MTKALFYSIVVSVLMLGGAFAAPTKPHIVFILADDLGWPDIGRRAGVSNLHNNHCSEYHLTPQINRLAEMGMTFTRAYAAPNCAPTRAALMSGMAASRHGITAVFDRGGMGTGEVKLPNNPVELASPFTTIAETLNSAGYATGHFGKWHIGRFDGTNAVQQQGFDINVGGAGNEHSSLTSGDEYHANSNGQWINGAADKTTEILPVITNPAVVTNKLTRTPGEHMSDALTDEAQTWMASQVAANPDTPVFVYLAHHATHSPIDPKASDEAAIPATSTDPRHTRRNYAGLLYGMDRSVGTLLDYLENNNDDEGNSLIDNTIFVFYSDNGAEDTSLAGRNAPLRSAKGSQFEGGVRVPAFISTPAMRAAGQADTATSQAVHVMDMHATLAALAGTTAPAGLDGVDFSQVLTNPTNTFSRDIFEWWLQQRGAVGEAHATLHRGDMKLIWYPFEAFNSELTARFDLFDVVDAPTNGVAGVDPVTGSITYTHSGANLNPDALTYTVQNTSGETSNVAQVEIAVAVGWDGDAGQELGTAANWSPDTAPSNALDFIVSTNAGFGGTGNWLMSLGTGNTPFGSLTFSAAGTGDNAGRLGIRAGANFGGFQMAGDMIFSGDSITNDITLQNSVSKSLSYRTLGSHSIINNTAATLIFGDSNAFSFYAWQNSSRVLYMGGSGDIELGANTVFGSATTGNARKLLRLWSTPDFGGTLTIRDGVLVRLGNDIRAQGGVIKIEGMDTIHDDVSLSLANEGFGAEIDISGLSDTMHDLNSFGSAAGGGTLRVDGSTAVNFEDLRVTSGSIDIEGWSEGNSSLVFADLGGTYYGGTIAEGEEIVNLTIGGEPAYLTQTGGNWAVSLNILEIVASTNTLAGNDQIRDLVRIIMDDGTLNLNGYSETVAALSVNGSSVIDLNSGGAIAFANSTNETWTGTLTITGTLGATSVRFGTDATGLTSEQLSMIELPSGIPAALDANGYLVEFDPTMLSGALVWLDAQDASSVAESGGYVDVWSNKVNLGNNAEQLTSSRRPQRLVSAINGYPALQFDGSDDRMLFQSDVDATPGEYHVFAMVMSDTVGGNWQRIMATGGSATPAYNWELWRPAEANVGKLFDGFAISRFSTSNETIEGLVLGASGTEFNRFAGYIGEVVIYDRILGDSEKQDVFDYLNARWGVAASEPDYSYAAAPTLRTLGDQAGVLMSAGVKDFYNYADQTEFMDVVSNNFSCWVPINDLKWAMIRPSESTFDFTDSDEHVNEAVARGMKVRGHTLVWHNTLPGWLTGGSYSASELETIMTNHIATVVGRYAGQIQYWDVVNEAFVHGGTLRSTIWSAVPDYIHKAFIAAHAADPEAKLLLNDYENEAVVAKSDGMYHFVTNMLAQGIPIHAVGFQMHTDALGGSYASMVTNFQRFADLGLEIHITEMDVRVPEIATQEWYEKQALVYSNVFAAAQQSGALKSFTQWGTSDKDENLYNHPGWHRSKLLDLDYNIKPAYDALRGALQEVLSNASPIENWRVEHFGSIANEGDGADTADPSGDGVVNLAKFASGLDPNVFDTSSLDYDGSTLVSRGLPTIYTGAEPLQALFLRRTNHVAAGLDYTVQFSANLLSNDWADAVSSPIWLENDGDVDLMYIEFPTNLVEQGFFRLGIERSN